MLCEGLGIAISTAMITVAFEEQDREIIFEGIEDTMGYGRTIQIVV